MCNCLYQTCISVYFLISFSVDMLTAVVHSLAKSYPAMQATLRPIAMPSSWSVTVRI